MKYEKIFRELDEDLKIKNKGNSFEFTETEKNIINEAKAEYLKALQRIWSEAEYFVDEDNNQITYYYN